MLDWNDRRLAVFDRDVDAIIRTHARDRKVAAWLQDTAQAFEEIGEIGEIGVAIDWAHQATDHAPGHQSLKAAEYRCDLLADTAPPNSWRREQKCSGGGHQQPRRRVSTEQPVPRGTTTTTTSSPH